MYIHDARITLVFSPNHSNINFTIAYDMIDVKKNVYANIAQSVFPAQKKMKPAKIRGLPKGYPEYGVNPNQERGVISQKSSPLLSIILDW